MLHLSTHEETSENLIFLLVMLVLLESEIHKLQSLFGGNSSFFFSATLELSLQDLDQIPILHYF